MLISFPPWASAEAPAFIGGPCENDDEALLHIPQPLGSLLPNNLMVGDEPG
jgi:hypothetical protein